MNPLALQLLKKERVGVLAVVLSDGTPHAAVLHYSEATEPVKIFIQTSPTVKTKALIESGGSGKAAMTVGLSEEDFVTLQMRGEVRIVANPQELEDIYKIHYAKRPKAEKFKDEDTFFLEFTPKWWRYSDFKARPKKVITEEA